MEELQRQIEELTKRVNDLEQVQNLDSFENFVNLLGGKFLSVKSVNGDNDNAVDRNISLSGDAQDITVLAYPDYFYITQFNGTIYYIPLFASTRF